MNLFNSMYQNVFFRTMDIARGRNTIARLNFLRKTQYWTQDQLGSWQLRRLNNLLEIARIHSVFYAKKLDSIKLPLQNLSEIEQLPILTKNDIRLYLESILCDNANKSKLELSKTGGSTGEPSFYYLDRNSKDWNRGSVYRSSEWANTFLGDKTVQMTGSFFDSTEFNKLKYKIIFYLQRYKDLPVASVNEEIYDKYFHDIQKYKPTSIWGYASGIYLFSKFIKEHYPYSNFDFLKAAITSSETLRPEWREGINQVFNGQKVFDHYGSREAYIASECKEHNGYHIHGETIFLEIVDAQGRQLPPGEMGRILITDLSNLSFPFIRYEIGDVGIMGEKTVCPCGVTLPKLQAIEGRISDVLVFKDRMITPHFNSLMFESDTIDQYQILQNNIEEIIVKIVKNTQYTNEIEINLKKGLQKLIGKNVLIHFDYVDNIEVPKSGKRRYVISNIGLS